MKLRMCGTITLQPPKCPYGADSENFAFYIFTVLFERSTVSFKCVLQASYFHQNKISSAGSAAIVSPRSLRTSVNFTCSFTSTSFSDV
jgi:hypothetical protein